MPDGGAFHTIAQIGPNRSLTPAGFMLCRNVPIARTGTQVYGPGETPIPPGPDGVTRIHREEKDVFRPEFIASFNGMAFTVAYDAIESGDPLNHPTPSGVGQWTVHPQNWRDHIGGVVLNPRRGEGVESDFVVADILVCDHKAIEAIDSGSRQVSAGYNAEYEEIAPGEGRQYDMVANHVALVFAARCGPRCSIGDKKTVNMTGDSSMPITLKSLVADVRAAWKTKDEAKVEEVLERAEKAETNDRKMSDEDIEKRFGEVKDGLKAIGDSVKSMTDSLPRAVADAVKAARDAAEGEESDEEKKKKAEAAAKDAATESELKEEAPAGAADKAAKATDSAYLVDSFQDTIAAAEILAPGIRIPVFDQAMDPKKNLDTICRLRRTALDLAYATPEGRGMVEEINGGKPLELDGMSCGAVRTLFRSAVAAKRIANNAAHRAHDTRSGKDTQKKAGITNLSDLNKYYAEHYKSAAAR